jgi:hypothetical protein
MDDAVLELPQSGERFVGVENLREWRSSYPASTTVEFREVRGERLLDGGDLDQLRRRTSHLSGAPNGRPRRSRGYGSDGTRTRDLRRDRPAL